MQFVARNRRSGRIRGSTIEPSTLPAPTVAERLFRAGRLDEAHRLLEAYCARRPDDVNGRFLWALVCRGRGEPRAAEVALKPLLGTARAPIQHLAGLVARDRGERRLADARLRRALVCDPAHSGAWQALFALDPAGRRGLDRAAAAAIVDPGDPDSWTDVVFAALVGGGLRLPIRTERRFAVAMARVQAAGEVTLAAAWNLVRDPERDAPATVEASADLEGVALLLCRVAARLRDDARAMAGLWRRVRMLCVVRPGRRLPWFALTALAARDAVPGGTQLSALVRRVVVFGGLQGDLAVFRSPFEATVQTKRQMIRGRQVAYVGWLGQALGIQAVSDATGVPVALRWADGVGLVRIGDRQVGYRVSSGQVLGLVTRIFMLEPGMWRWMAGFGPDDMLLDIGANVGIYTVAAAGLFGVRVAALEPYGPNLETLRRNVADNRLSGRVAVLPIAATDVERTGRLFHAGGAAGAAAQHFEDEGAGGAPDESFERVEGVPVDVLVARGTIPFPTRIKIDVDGNERAVIEGMTGTLADPRLHSVRLEVRWKVPEGRAVVERVESFGFRAVIDDDSKNLLFTRRNFRSK